MRTHYIYITTNLINGKKYLGQRLLPKKYNNINKDNYIGSGILITKAVKKYGRSSFSKEIIFVCFSHKEADKKEIELIKLYKCLENKDYWYNRDTGGQFYRHKNHSKYISNIMKEYYQDKENINNFRKSIAVRNGFETYKQYKDALKLKQIKDKLEKDINKEIKIYNNIIIQKTKRMLLESTIIKKDIAAIQKNNASVLKNEDIKKRYYEKRKEFDTNKIRKEGNILYNLLLDNDLYPFNKTINNYRIITFYKFKRYKTIETLKTNLIILKKELSARYFIHIDIEQLINAYSIR